MATSAARWNSCLKYVTQSRRVYFLNSLLADGGFGPLSSGDRQPEDHRQEVEQRIEHWQLQTEPLAHVRQLGLHDAL